MERLSGGHKIWSQLRTVPHRIQRIICRERNVLCTCNANHQLMSFTCPLPSDHSNQPCRHTLLTPLGTSRRSPQATRQSKGLGSQGTPVVIGVGAAH